MARKTRSPLKSKPLRNPGQSVDEMMQSTIDKGLAYTVSLVLLVVFVALEWVRWHLNVPYSPLVYTVIAVPVLWFGANKIRKIMGRVRRLKQGRDGEKIVAQYLNKKLRDGHVFHDIVGNNFNLDHVVVCKHGVFVIETKTYSKPESGDAKIVVEGQEIIINSCRNGKILNQARAGSNWLRGLLSELTGKKIKVKSVVVFPGWYINDLRGNKGLDVWVLNHKALPKWIANEPEKLSKQEQSLIAGFLTQLASAN